MLQESSAKIDGAVVMGAIASPFWLRLFDYGSHVVLVVGGLVLLAIRIALGIREWQRK